MVQASTEGLPQQFSEAVYAQLRGIAAAMLDRELPGHTLQPTALVNEAYLRLATQRELSGSSREQLLALGAIMIRRVLIDHYRYRTALKRGGAVARREAHGEVTVDDDAGVAAIEEALAKLHRVDPVKAHLVVLKFYGGMSVEQIAVLRGESSRKVARDWAFARAWLGRELSA